MWGVGQKMKPTPLSLKFEKIMEIWKDIEGYEGYYQVSNEGRVKSLDYNQTKVEKILKQHSNGLGYLHVGLCRNNKLRTYYVHRLVAETFIENPNNLPQVNHKDCKPTNNRVENLEWCTSSYNINYGDRNKKCALAEAKKVYQYTLDNELVKIWESTMAAGRNGFRQGDIVKCCNGERKTSKGYKWSYKPL